MKTKKTILFILTILFVGITFGQSKMYYSSKKKERIKRIILKSEIPSLKKLSKKKRAMFVETMAVFYALSNENQHKLVNNTIKSLAKDKYISKSQYAVLYKLMNSKKLNRAYLRKLSKQKINNKDLGSVLIKIVSKRYLDTYPGNSTTIPVQGYGWKKVAGSIIGAAAGAGAGFFAGAAPPVVVAGAILGAKIGGDIGEAIEEGDKKESATDTDNSSNGKGKKKKKHSNDDDDEDEPINTNEGNSCIGYPFTPPLP